jgi:hypothetical protein
MPRYRAKVECFHGAHLYVVGEEANFSAGEDVPEHFEPLDGEVVEEAAEPKARGKGRGNKPDAAD